jgi:hypothetical protein
VIISDRYLKNAKFILATVPTLLVGTGCYQHERSSMAAVRPGQTVRLVLTTERAASLASSIGPHATTVDGKIIGNSAAGRLLSVTQITRSSGPEEFMKDEPLTIPMGGADSVTIRKVDKPRTVLAFGAILAGVIAGNIAANQSGVFSAKAGPSGSTK